MDALECVRLKPRGAILKMCGMPLRLIREIYYPLEGIWARLEQYIRNTTSHVLFPILCQCDEDLDVFDLVLSGYPRRKLSGRFALAMRTTCSDFTMFLRSSAPTINRDVK